jgi:hypothetical protein
MTSPQDKKSDMLSKIIVFNDILSPLMIAVSKHIGLPNDKKSCDGDALLIAKLVENTVALTHEKTSDLFSEIDSWQAAKFFAGVVAANYEQTKDIINIKDFDIENLKIDMTKEKIKTYSSNENFKSAILFAMSPIVNAVAKFNFTKNEKEILKDTELQIATYTNNLFESINKKDLSNEYYNHLYVETLTNISKIFEVCYYNEIDASLSVPAEKRQDFIHKRMVESSDALDKVMDGFFNRISLISNISIALPVPLRKPVKI